MILVEFTVLKGSCGAERMASLEGTVTDIEVKLPNGKSVKHHGLVVLIGHTVMNGKSALTYGVKKL